MEGGDRDERKEKLSGRKLQREEKQTNAEGWRERKKTTIRKVGRKEEKASRAQGGGKVGTGGRGPGSPRREGVEMEVHRGDAKKEVKEGGSAGEEE